MEMAKKELEELLKDNRYVKGITNDNGIMYTDEFYALLYRKLESGDTSIKAYSSFGFDTNILGENRAYAACKRAKEKAVEPKKNIKYVNGTVPMNEMGPMTPEEELTYLRSRVHVLENMLDCKKKRPDIYQMAFPSSKKDK